MSPDATQHWKTQVDSIDFTLQAQMFVAKHELATALEHHHSGKPNDLEHKSDSGQPIVDIQGVLLSLHTTGFGVEFVLMTTFDRSQTVVALADEKIRCLYEKEAKQVSQAQKQQSWSSSKNRSQNNGTAKRRRELEHDIDI